MSGGGGRRNQQSNWTLFIQSWPAVWLRLSFCSPQESMRRRDQHGSFLWEPPTFPGAVCLGLSVQWGGGGGPSRLAGSSHSQSVVGWAPLASAWALGGLHLFLSSLDPHESRRPSLILLFSLCFRPTGLHSIPYIFLVLSHLGIFSCVVPAA